MYIDLSNLLLFGKRLTIRLMLHLTLILKRGRALPIAILCWLSLTAFLGFSFSVGAAGEIPDAILKHPLEGMYQDYSPLCFAVHPSGRYIATVHRRDKVEVEIWDVIDGRRVGIKKLDISSSLFDKNHTSIARFHPAGTHLYCNGFMIDMADGTADKVLAYDSSMLGHVASEGGAAFVFQNNGKYLVAVHCFDDVGRVATVEALNCGELRSVRPLGLSPSGDRLLLLGKSSQDKDVRTLADDTRDEWSLVWYDLKAKQLGQTKRISHAGHWGSWATSPDGKILAVVGGKTRIELWDIAGGNNDRVIKGHENEIKSLVFSPNGKMLASDAWDGLRLWEMPLGVEAGKSPIPSKGFTIPAFLDDNGSLVLIEDKQIYCVHGPSGRFKGHYILGNESVGFGWSAKGAELLAFCKGREQSGVSKIDVTTGAVKINLCEEKFIDNFLVNKSGDSAIAMRERVTSALLFHYDANTSKFRTRDLSREIKGKLFSSPFWVGDDSFFGFVFESDNNESLARICLVDAKTWRPVRTLDVGNFGGGDDLVVTASPKESAFALANSREGKVILIDAARSKTLREWDILGTGKKSRAVRKLQFSSDGTLLFALLERQKNKGVYEDLRVWSVDSGAEFPLPDLPATTEGGREIKAIDLASTGERLAVSTDRTIGLWKIGTDQITEERVIINGAFNSPFQIKFSPDGTLLASTSYGKGDYALKVWRTGDAPQITSVMEQMTIKDAVPYRVKEVDSPKIMETSNAATSQPKTQLDPIIFEKLNRFLALESEIKELAKSHKILTENRLPISKVGDEYIVVLKSDTPKGSVWGSGPYTSDSNLRSAAIHAGVLPSEGAGIVRVVCVESPDSFSASFQNGVSSSSYGRFGLAFHVFGIANKLESEGVK